MKRDTTGKFIRNWDDETKQRVSVTLTATAWRLLDEQAKQQGISRSELIEQMARSFDRVQQPFQQEEDRADEAVQATDAELALQKAERKVDSILESISDAFVTFDREWRYTYVNRAAVELLEKTPAELIGKHLWTEVFPELVGELQYQELHRATAEQVAVSWEEWSASTQRWLEVNAYPTDEGMAVYFRDITDRKRVENERKQAEAALRESEEKLRLFIQQAPVSVAMLDRDMCYIAVSQRWMDIHKLDSAETEVVGRSHYELFPNLSDEWKQVHQRCLAGATEQQDEDLFRLPDGSEQYLRWEVQPWYISSGNIGGIVIFSEDITARKQVEAERERLLRELETERVRLEAVLRQMPAGVFIADAASDEVVMINDQAKQITGYQFEQALQPEAYDSEVSFEVFHLNGRRYAAEEYPLVRALRQGETVTNEEMELHRADGGYVRITANSAPIRNSQSEIVAAVVVFQDVTVRRQVEAALQNSAERLSVALEAAKLGDWSWDAATDLVTFSERAAEIFGIPPGPYMTWRQIQTLLHESDREQARLQVEQAIAHHSDYDIEYRVMHSDETERWVAAKGRAQYDGSGQVLGMLGVVQDITDRKQAEAEIAVLNRDLQNRVNELETLFEVIPIGILITDDPTFKQVRSNPAFAQILGLATSNASSTPSQETPLPSYKIFSYGKELTPQETPLRRAALEGVEIEGAEVDILRGDGASFNLYGYASPLFDEQGKVRGAVGAFLDITDRKRAEAEREQLLEREQAARKQAEAANRIKDEFLAVLSHELRTPLNPILGWSKLLRTGKLTPEKTAMALETIERNAKLQTQLIEDLLDVSRILRGKLSLNMTPVDLPSVIEAALETVRLAAEAKSIQIQRVLEPIAAQVLGDSARLQQVVWNLLSNAVKFTPAGGHVEVRLEEIDTRSYAQITVSDTGKGISPDFLPHVFDYFRQADATITRQFGGLGLGLAIVRQLVELHGGTVQVESPGENQGTTFTVKLPLLKERRNSTSSETDTLYLPFPRSHPLQGIRVLVVDDEADAQDLTTFILERAGAIPTAVSSAIEALAIFPQQNPDVIISDIGMPEMDGYMLIQQIRAMQQGEQVPAIALTAYAGEMNQRQAMAVGFQHHLTKPADPNELIGVILSLIKK